MTKPMRIGRKVASLCSAAAMGIAASMSIAGTAHADPASDFLTLELYYTDLEGFFMFGCTNVLANDGGGTVTGAGINGDPAEINLTWAADGSLCVTASLEFVGDYEYVTGVYTTTASNDWVVFWVGW